LFVEHPQTPPYFSGALEFQCQCKNFALGHTTFTSEEWENFCAAKKQVQKVSYDKTWH